eukprot:601803-Hanusia_phi.AAC.1
MSLPRHDPISPWPRVAEELSGLTDRCSRVLNTVTVTAGARPARRLAAGAAARGSGGMAISASNSR